METGFKFLVLSCILCCCTVLQAARPGIASRGACEEELLFLTDSLRGGRAMGSAGSQDVAFYLLRQLRSEGLRTTVQTFEHGGKAGHNVIGVTPGWYEEYIVVGAYYDGLGTLGEDFYPGADSNASGVAALLSLARSLPELCTGRTGVIFVAFDGHNASLSGSSHFLSRYRFEYPISRMVNLDILGSSLAPLHEGREDYLLALGGGQWRFSIENANREAGLDLAYDYYGSVTFTDLFYRKISDQRCFLEAGIPCVMFTSGITMNTNKTADTISALDIPVLEKRIGLIGRWIASQL